MPGETIGYTPATELAAQIRTKRISPREVVSAILDRIAALEPRLNAFALLTAESATDAAEAAEQAVMAGAKLGPLHGLPVTIKDLTYTGGVPTEYGSFLRQGFVPDADAPLVSRLKAAGAIVLGKTTTPEFGWKGVSRSPLTGVTHNPWRHGLNAGASSAGAAVAAAAGFGPLHQGSDGAGSIRMPAHFCGVFGIKPSFGRVPNYPVAPSDNTVHNGPLTRNVADAALMLRVMAGPHAWDYTSAETPPADYPALLGGGVTGARIAFSADLGHARVDPEIAELVRAAAGVFVGDLGAEVEDVVPEWGKDGPELARFFWPAHLTIHAPRLPEWRNRMDPGLVACIEDGMRHGLPDYQRMRERKSAYCTAIGRFFEGWDFLLTPAVSVAAFPAEKLQPAHWPQHEWDWLSWAEFSYPFNLSGNPAASIPCGFTKDGLPVGLQIVGRRFDDAGVLRAAAAFEQARPWAQHRPGFGD